MSEGNNDSLVALPREVVEQVLAAMQRAGEQRGSTAAEVGAMEALRAALEQPQNHVFDAGNMVPAGWKLVPIEPTDDMLYDIQEFSHILPPRGKRIWAHMLAAAPKPPAIEQPQGGQEPDWQDLYRKEKRRAEMWIAKYEKDIGKLELAFPVAAQPQGEQQPVAWIENLGGDISYNPYHDAARKLPDGVRFDLYTRPQNLNCKSNQARLATLWGYVKADQQPKATFDEVWDAIDWGKWRMAPIRELVREIHSKTSPQPPSKPLTPDVSGVDGVNARLHFRRGWKSAERAHGIGGEA